MVLMTEPQRGDIFIASEEVINKPQRGDTSFSKVKV